MVEWWMELVGMCVEENLMKVVMCMKGWNRVMMVGRVGVVVEEMEKENMGLGVELGVREGGEGEEGGMK